MVNIRRDGLGIGRLHTGFTLIEVLVAVTILTVLTTATVVVLDPIEQLNRSRDTTTRADAGRLVAAVERYYALNGFYPWQTDASDTGNFGFSWNMLSEGVADADDCPMIEKLGVTASENCSTPGINELRQDFLERVTVVDPSSPYETSAVADRLYVFHSGAADAPYVCFAPVSKAFQAEATARVTAGVPSGYPDGEGEAVDNVADCGPGGFCSCLP